MKKDHWNFKNNQYTALVKNIFKKISYIISYEYERCKQKEHIFKTTLFYLDIYVYILSSD